MPMVSLSQSRPQYVGCTQYMATRTAILDVEIFLNQCLEEIAKKEAQLRSRPISCSCRPRPDGFCCNNSRCAPIRSVHSPLASALEAGYWSALTMTGWD
jgi:hypothetical protein